MSEFVAEMARRYWFVRHVVNLIEHVGLKRVAIELLMEVPTAFWDAPASSSGKHHPAYALGDGGSVRHTLVVIHIARDLINTSDLVVPQVVDAVTFAAAFHDTYKGGDTGTEPWTETVPDHPTRAYERILARVIDDGTQDELDMRLTLAALAVLSHMTKWGDPPVPARSDYQQAVAYADYIASRKYLKPAGYLAELLEQYR